MQIIFETPRIILREFGEEDAPLILNLNSDPEVLKYVHEPLLKNEAEAKEVLDKIILPQYKIKLGRWAIYTKATYEFIGWCGLKKLEETGITDLAYRLLKTAWGKGYATEAAQYTLIYGLKNLEIETITAMAHVNNIASINILEKIGMNYQRDDILDQCPVKIFTLSLPVSKDFC